MRTIGVLICLIMLLVGWLTIVGTTYFYFPQTMNPASSFNYAFAIIAILVIFPIMGRVWQTWKQRSYEEELDKNVKSRL